MKERVAKFTRMEVPPAGDCLTAQIIWVTLDVLSYKGDSDSIQRPAQREQVAATLELHAHSRYGFGRIRRYRKWNPHRGDDASSWSSGHREVATVLADDAAHDG